MFVVRRLHTRNKALLTHILLLTCLVLDSQYFWEYSESLHNIPKGLEVEIVSCSRVLC